MTAEPVSIRDAWSKIPSPGSVETGFERFTGKRMERILATVVAIGSAVLGAQALISALTTLSRADSALIVMLLVVFVPFVAMLIACLIGRGVRTTSGAFAIAYVLALAAWPVIGQGDSAASEQPWIFFLVNVGVVAAMLAFPLWLQFVWAAGMPFVYGYVRLVQGEFSSAFWVTTAFDVSFTLILGLVIISLGWMFRSVAAGVDDVRGRAVSSYAAAAAAAAAEEERITMSALMHDSVLAALIAGERAESERARDLAVAMAREALTRLANTEAARGGGGQRRAGCGRADRRGAETGAVGARRRCHRRRTRRHGNDAGPSRPRPRARGEAGAGELGRPRRRPRPAHRRRRTR
ncbi:hypothetical protein QFZ53_003146 [Microbacterium natoriense]|uniref:ATP-binding protein n=1 Tax=Microbacterium natoriense TaxID=284570 RepID=A0AAW8F1R1_9MICO|nr:ATP-binding protein [Microbacterium natoriense]MDQ0648950.1 hypothetical protein [Microbacterium natoriense]